MADITQRIRIDGSDTVKKQLADVGDAGKQAFSQISDAVEKGSGALQNFDIADIKSKIAGAIEALGSLARAFDNAAASGGNAASILRQAASAAAAAGGQIEGASSRFSLIGKTLLVAGGAAAGLGGLIFAAAKKAADGAKEIGDAADESGTSLESFQKASFILQQMGLSGDQAKEAIKNLTDAASKGAKDAADKLQKMGFTFVNDADGIKAAKSLMQQFGGANIALDPLLKKLKDLGVVIPAGADQIKTAADLAQRFGAAGAGALSKIKDETPDATQTIREVAQAIAALSDEGLQKQAAINAFGDELGPKLVDKLKEGQSGVDEFLKDFANLRLGVSSDAVDLSESFNAAMARFNTASETARIEFGSHFLPIVTEGIRQFTNLIRLNRQPIDEWAKGIVSTFQSLVSDIFKLFNGQNQDIQNSWLLTLKDAIVAIGTAAVNVFNNILVPAFDGLSKIAQVAIDKINGFFGTKLSLADVGIAGVLSFLIGGFNSLLVVITALFGGSGPAIDAFKAKLDSLGISLDGIKKFASDVFTELSKAFSQTHTLDAGPLGKFEVSAKGLSEVLLGAAAAILAIKKAADFAAPAISLLVGREVSGGAVLVAAEFLNLTGIMHSLETTLIAVAAGLEVIFVSLGIFARGLALVGTLMTGLAALIGWPLLLAAAIVTAIAAFRQFSALLDPIAKLLNGLFGSDFFSGVGLAETAIGGLIAAFIALAGAEIAAGKASGLLVAALSLLIKNPLVLLFVTLTSQLLSLSGAGKQVQNTLTDIGKASSGLSGQFADVQKQIDAAKKSLDDLNGAKKDQQDNQGIVFKTVGQGVPDGFKSVSDNAQEAKSSVDDLNKSLAGGDQASQITSFFKAIGDFLKSDQQDTFGIGAAFASLWDKIKQGAAETADVVKNLLSNINPVSSANAAEASASDNSQGQSGGIAQAIVSSFQQAASQVQSIWGSVVSFISDPSQIAGALSGLADAITSAFQSMVNAIEQAWSGLPDFIGGIVAQIESVAQGAVQALQQVIDAANQAAAAAASVGSGGSSDQGQGFAGGGSVSGPGGPTDDSILAWLSNGEFVMSARAVRAYGTSFMAAINTLRMPRDFFRGFAMGGLVDGLTARLMVPKFATGGLAAGVGGGILALHPITLNIGGQSISGLLAPAAVAANLQRYAVSSRSRRAGRSPNHGIR